MSRELVGAIAHTYDAVQNDASGRPSREAVVGIREALNAFPGTAAVALLVSAARACVLPQLSVPAVDACARAVFETRQALAARGPCPPAIDAIIAAAPAAGTADADQAQRCLGYALAYAATGAAGRFAAGVDAFIAAQHRIFAHPSSAREGWLGWLDDVVSRADRFTVEEALVLLERTIRVTVPMLLDGYDWEAAGARSGAFEIWTRDASTKDLVERVMLVQEPKVVDRTMQIRVLAQPGVVVDPLRIEFFVEHFILRMFLNGTYAGDFDAIAYAHLGTGEAWTAEA